jgi:hypothetical protein
MSTLSAYCIKCRISVTTHDYEVTTTDSGRSKAHSICPVCGTPIQRILGTIEGVNK